MIEVPHLKSFQEVYYYSGLSKSKFVVLMRSEHYCLYDFFYDCSEMSRYQKLEEMHKMF